MVDKEGIILKCKTNYKSKGGKCVKRKGLFSSRKNKFLDGSFIISLILFTIFSIVLFINNSTDLFNKLGWYYNINYMVWIGVAGCCLYAIYKSATRRDLF